jgi:hypothetical protein
VRKWLLATVHKVSARSIVCGRTAGKVKMFELDAYYGEIGI